MSVPDLISVPQRWHTKVILSVVLTLLTVGAYWHVFHCDFVTFDDPQYVSQNPRVLAGLSASGAWYAWTTNDCANWHPLTWLSLQLDATLWGKGPAGFHATNLVLHALNSVLLFLVLESMTGHLGASALVAAFFAAHPLHVESVAWISERKDVLSTLFLVLTLAAYTAYVRQASVVRYLLVVFPFTLGLLAKPMLVTLPLLLLLLDFWPLNRCQQTFTSAVGRLFSVRPEVALLLEKIPLFCLAFIDGVITIGAQRDAIKVLTHLPLSTRLANLCEAYLWYLNKTFLPLNLAVFYPHAREAHSWPLVITGLLVLLVISGAVLWRARTSPWAAVGWGWFLVSLLPVIGLLQVGAQAYADRYSYIPHIGLLVFVIWELTAFAGRGRGQWLVGGLATAALVGCGWLTVNQVHYWTNSATLWTRAIEVTSKNGVAHAHLADVRQDAGDHAEAIEHFARAVELAQESQAANAGWYANAHYQWAQSLLALERFEDAERKLREVLTYDENEPRAIVQRQQLLNQLGRQEEAVELYRRYRSVFEKLAQSTPSAAELKQGLTLARHGKFAQAITHFEKAIELSPDSAAAYNNLGLAQRELGRMADAKASLLRAVERNPQLASAHFTLGEILLAEGDPTSAKRHFAEAYRLNPQDAEAKTQLERLSTGP